MPVEEFYTKYYESMIMDKTNMHYILELKIIVYVELIDC